MNVPKRIFAGFANFLRREWRKNRKLICFFIFIVIPVKSSVADWNWVPSGSMNPTLGSRVKCNRY